MKRAIFIGVILGAICVPGLTVAQHASSNSPWPLERRWGGGVGGSLNVSTGLLRGEAFERVYDNSYGRQFKVSELKWDLDNLLFAGFEGTLMVMSRFRVNGGVWLALTEGGGGMVDRDWIYDDIFMTQWAAGQRDLTDNDWTDRSIHDSVPVEQAAMGDVNLEVRALSVGPVTFSGLMGYRRSYWEWSARGGTYIYSSSAPSQFRDLIGTFPDEPGIDYNQTFEMLYLGGRLEVQAGPFHLNSYLAYGPNVVAEDEDFHFQRSTEGLLFEGEFNGGDYLGAGVTGTLTFQRMFHFSLSVQYRAVSEIVGDMTITDPGSGMVYSPEEFGDLQNSASVENSSTTIAFNFSWSFNSGR